MLMIDCHVDQFMASILSDTTVAPLTPRYLLNSRVNRLVNHRYTSSQSESALVLESANLKNLCILLLFILLSLFYTINFPNRFSSETF